MRLFNRIKANSIQAAALKVAAAYLAAAVAWIFGSDHLAALIVATPDDVARIQTLKGLALVSGSAVLIYWLVRRQLRRREQAEHLREMSEGRLRQVLDAVNDGVWDVDLLNPAQVTWNRRWFEIVGHQPGDLRSMDDWRTIIHPDDLPAVNRALAEHLDGRSRFYVRELRVRRDDGTWAWVLSRGQVVERTPDGRPRRMVGTYTDISAMKAQEQRLSRAVEELTYSRVQLARFAYAAAHDLKEPVRLIGSYASLLRRRLGGNLDPEAVADLLFLTDAAVRIDAMVEGLLRSLEQAPARPFQPVDLNQVLAEVRTQLAANLGEARATLAVDSLPVVMGDHLQLRLVFEHLIGNSLKFRHPARPPRITVSARHTDGAWVVTVADNGIGFPAERAESIFLAFTRLHAPGTYPGAGMGLSVCRAIIDSHGGRIAAAPRADQEGSLFTITLPTTGGDHGEDEAAKADAQ